MDHYVLIEPIPDGMDDADFSDLMREQFKPIEVKILSNAITNNIPNILVKARNMDSALQIVELFNN